MLHFTRGQDVRRTKKHNICLCDTNPTHEGTPESSSVLPCSLWRVGGCRVSSQSWAGSSNPLRAPLVSLDHPDETSSESHVGVFLPQVSSLEVGFLC